jgi:hypothetical protein
MIIHCDTVKAVDRKVHWLQKVHSWRQVRSSTSGYIRSLCTGYTKFARMHTRLLKRTIDEQQVEC